MINKYSLNLFYSIKYKLFSFSTSNMRQLQSSVMFFRIQRANRENATQITQIGSHYHFFESNKGLEFDRRQSVGKRLDIPAGTAIRFEPGDQREVSLVPYAGERKVFGFNGLINDSLQK